MPDHSVYCRITDEPVHRTWTLVPGQIHMDIDKNSNIVGIEVLGVGSVTVDGHPANGGRVLIHPRYTDPGNGAPVDFNG